MCEILVAAKTRQLAITYGLSESALTHGSGFGKIEARPDRHSQESRRSRVTML